MRAAAPNRVRLRSATIRWHCRSIHVRPQTPPPKGTIVVRLPARRLGVTRLRAARSTRPPAALGIRAGHAGRSSTQAAQCRERDVRRAPAADKRHQSFWPVAGGVERVAGRRSTDSEQCDKRPQQQQRAAAYAISASSHRVVERAAREDGCRPHGLTRRISNGADTSNFVAREIAAP